MQIVPFIFQQDIIKTIIPRYDWIKKTQTTFLAKNIFQSLHTFPDIAYILFVNSPIQIRYIYSSHTLYSTLYYIATKWTSAIRFPHKP